jgi:hypothetical protein
MRDVLFASQMVHVVHHDNLTGLAPSEAPTSAVNPNEFLFASPSPWRYNQAVHAKPRALLRQGRILGPDRGSVGREWEISRRVGGMMRNREFVIVSYWNAFREEKLSFVRALRRQPPLFLASSLGLSVLCAALFYLTSDGAWLIVFFMGIGAFLRDIGIALRIVRDWPYVKRHLDWDRIDETLAKYREE